MSFGNTPVSCSCGEYRFRRSTLHPGESTYSLVAVRLGSALVINLLYAGTGQASRWSPWSSCFKFACLPNKWIRPFPSPSMTNRNACCCEAPTTRKLLSLRCSRSHRTAGCRPWSCRFLAFPPPHPECGQMGDSENLFALWKGSLFPRFVHVTQKWVDILLWLCIRREFIN